MSKDISGTIFVLLCDEISGTIGALVVGDTFEYENVILPIDRLVVYFKRVELDDSKFSPEENV